MDEIVHFLGLHLTQEISVVDQAPIMFALVCIVSAVVLYFAFRAYYSRELAFIPILEKRLEDAERRALPATTREHSELKAKSFEARYQVVRKIAELAVKCRETASATHIWITFHDRIIEKPHDERTDEEHDAHFKKDLAQIECARLGRLAEQLEKLSEELIKHD